MYRSQVEGKGGISAKVVADSKSEAGVRITTLELNYPRFIHAEFMTHRVFSRNASSSRAIPVAKMIEQVEKNPAMPIHWGKNQAGMQAKEEIVATLSADVHWTAAADAAVRSANRLHNLGLHKQVINRILEPFQFIKVVVTATEWDNFFDLRLHEDAQPEIHELARVMKEAMKKSRPYILYEGDYHVPYVKRGYIAKSNPDIKDATKASVARCARVSYLNHDNSRPDIAKDIELYNRLLIAGHMSPFEHVATPLGNNVDKGLTHISDTHRPVEECVAWSGNFREWVQYRQTL